MPELPSVAWALANLSVASLALYLLERAHREAMKRLVESFDCERRQHNLLVAFLEAAVMRQEEGADA